MSSVERGASEAIDSLGGADRAHVERIVQKKLELRDKELKAGTRGARGSDNQNQDISSCPAVGQRGGVLPEGQARAKEWIVMDLGNRPPADWLDPWRWGGGVWRLHVRGHVKEEKDVRLRSIKKLGVREYKCDWHCVTGWSYQGLRLMGVPLDDFIHHICEPKPDWKSLMQVSADGYTCNVLREDAVGTGAFIALADAKGEPISKEHGGIRIVFPALYGWKSAKYLSELRFDTDGGAAGFWERCGCHMRGRWVYGERWAPERRRVWEVLAWMTDQYRVWLGYNTWVKVMKYGGLAVGALAKVAKVLFPGFFNEKRIASGAAASTQQPQDQGHCARQVDELDLEFGDGAGMLSGDYTYEVVGWGWAVDGAEDGREVFLDERKAACNRSGRCVLDCSHPVPGNRSRVVFSDGTCLEVPTNALTPVAKGRKVVSVASTAEFHWMAKTQMGAGDRVLEIGCDFGGATKLMSAADDVIAVDKCSEHVAQAAQQHGSSNMSFQVLDALVDLEGLKGLGRGRNKVMIDINGNREIWAVVRCVSLVQQLIHPDVIVVKSVELTNRLLRRDESNRTEVK